MANLADFAAQGETFRYPLLAPSENNVCPSILQANRLVRGLEPSGLEEFGRNERSVESRFRESVRLAFVSRQQAEKQTLASPGAQRIDEGLCARRQSAGCVNGVRRGRQRFPHRWAP